MLASFWNPSPSVSLQAVTLWRASVCSRGITLSLLSRWLRACSTFGSWRVCRALSPRLLCCPTRPSTCVSSRSRDCQVTLLVFVGVCSAICAAGVCVCVSARTTSCFPSQTLQLNARTPTESTNAFTLHTGRVWTSLCVCVCVWEVTK